MGSLITTHADLISPKLHSFRHIRQRYLGMDHPYHPSADACSSDEAEELPHLPSNTNCKMCAEVADRIASAQQKISGYFSDGKRRSTCVEVDCIDLGTPADFQSRSGCSTCRDISWFFKPTKGIKDDAVDGALSHLIIRLETFLYPKGWYLEITPVRRIPSLQPLAKV